MTHDKATLESVLAKLTNTWNELQAGLAQKQQDLQRLNEQIAQRSAEIERQKGALAFNQIFANQVKEELARLETPTPNIDTSTKRA